MKNSWPYLKIEYSASPSGILSLHFCNFRSSENILFRRQELSLKYRHCENYPEKRQWGVNKVTKKGSHAWNSLETETVQISVPLWMDRKCEWRFRTGKRMAQVVWQRRPTLIESEVKSLLTLQQEVLSSFFEFLLALLLRRPSFPLCVSVSEAELVHLCGFIGNMCCLCFCLVRVVPAYRKGFHVIRFGFRTDFSVKHVIRIGNSHGASDSKGLGYMIWPGFEL